MFIIEGLGNRVADKWGRAIKDQLNLADDQVSFLIYHALYFDRSISFSEQAKAAFLYDSQSRSRQFFVTNRPTFVAAFYCTHPIDKNCYSSCCSSEVLAQVFVLGNEVLGYSGGQLSYSSPFQSWK